MSAHTPGPWAVDDDGEVTGVEGQAVVASVYKPDDFPCFDAEEDDPEGKFPVECAANAALIAAAPDLLKAAEFARDFFVQVKGWTDDDAIVRALNAAIAKATP